MNILCNLYICSKELLNAMDTLTYNRIKEVIARKAKTSRLVADHLKVREETVSSWCSNRNQPSIQTLFKLAKFLGVEATDLLVSLKDLEKIHKKKIGHSKK